MDTIPGFTDMHGKLCVVTGGTGGIGYETALGLAKLGAKVVIVGHDKDRGESAAATIRAKVPGVEIDLLLADLSIQAEVRRLAETILARYNRIDVLLNNAGGIFMRRRLTRDKIEETFALNHLSYFLLTNLLLERIIASAPARIINVSSGSHYDGLINFTDIQGERHYSGYIAYAQSKLANVLFTYELARRLKGTDVTANALHPGFVASRFGQGNGLVVNTAMHIAHLFAISPDQGAETSIYLASSPDVERMTGKYFSRKQAVESSEASYIIQDQHTLWELSSQMTGILNPVP